MKLFIRSCFFASLHKITNSKTDTWTPNSGYLNEELSKSFLKEEFRIFYQVGRFGNEKSKFTFVVQCSRKVSNAVPLSESYFKGEWVEVPFRAFIVKRE